MFHAVLKQECGLKEARNYGIGGTRFSLQKGNDWRPLDNHVDVNSFSERFDKMDDDADMVVVFGGTNDYGHGDAPLGCFDDKTPDTFYGACHYLFTGLINRYPGKPIIIMTPLHRCNEDNVRGDGWTAEEAADLKTYVNIIREVAEYYSLPVLDLFAESGIQPKVDIIREKFCPDGLHPNDAGHVLLAKKIYAKLLDM